MSCGVSSNVICTKLRGELSEREWSGLHKATLYDVLTVAGCRQAEPTPKRTRVVYYSECTGLQSPVHVKLMQPPEGHTWESFAEVAEGSEFGFSARTAMFQWPRNDFLHFI